MITVNAPEELSKYNFDKIYKENFVDSNKIYDKPKPILKFDDIDVLTEGNVSVIQGKAKSRKTFFLQLLCDMILSSGIHDIVIIDAEQYKYHSWLFKRRLSRLNQYHDYVKMINLRKYSKDVKIQFVEDYILKHKPKLIILDNIREFIRDFNDLNQTDDLISTLTQLSEFTGTHICNVIHENKGDGNARGHLGSELIRICETTFSLIADENITTVKGAYTRNGHFEPFNFEVVDGIPQIISAEKKDLVF